MVFLTKKTQKVREAELDDRGLTRIIERCPSLVRNPNQLHPWGNAANWERDRWPQTAGRYQFLSHVEQSSANPDWPYFEYEINSQGFRGAWPGSDAEPLLVLGCSFTFGEGLDKGDTFWGMLDASHGPAVNLGVPGAGHSQIADLFWAALGAWPRAKRAIITWPNMTRFNYVNSRDQIWPIHPHLDHAGDPEFSSVWKSFWSSWSTNNIWHSFARAVELTETLAHSRGVQILHGAWGGREPERIIEQITGRSATGFAYATNGVVPEVARDGHHPGRTQNHAYYLRLRSLLDAD